MPVPRQLQRCCPALFLRMVLVVICCCFYLVMVAQEFSSVHYDEKSGLPSNTIYDVSQDTDGFVWFATENGLCRFDGLNFKNFSTDDGLPDNSILRMHADNTGRVYFSPFTHIPYYLYKERVHKLKVPREFEEGSKLILEFFSLSDKTIMVTADRTSYMVDENDSLILLNKVYKDLPDEIIVSFIIGDTIVAGSDDVAFRINAKTGHFRRTENDIIWRKIVPLKNGIMYQRGFTPRNMVFINGQLSGDMYYSTDEGNALSIYSTIDGRLLAGIQLPKISNCYRDSEGNLWVTTNGNGIYRIPSFEFRHARFQNSGDVFSINATSAGILVGTDFSKLFLLNTSKNTTPVLLGDHTNFLKNSVNGYAVGAGSNRVTSLFVDKNVVYEGTDAFTLKLAGDRPPLFSRIYPVKDIDSFGNRLLICTGNTVVLADAADLRVIDTLLPERSLTGAYYNGEYYIASNNGLIKINPTNKQVTNLRDQHPAFQSRIARIRRGTDNDLWIASSGSGLVRYKDGKVIQVFTKKNGLTSDICTSLFVDGDIIWVGTNKGLNKINLSGAQPGVYIFTTANGLVADFVNTVFVHGDTIYAGGSAGLLYFNKRLDTLPSICRLHILQVSQANRILPADSVYEFPYRTLNIRFDFTAISFKSGGNNRYYYKLEGLDTGWNVTSNTFINYVTLPPGKYRLVLKAINKFGVESETKTVSIHIAHPWWQSWWVIPLGCLLAAAAIFIAYRAKVAGIRKKEAIKRQNEARLVLLEQQALQAQMNPHFIFNCLNSIQSYILKLDAAGASKYLNGFASMIRQTLDFSSRLLISVADEVKYIHTYLQLEKLRYKEKFNYTVEIDDEIDQATTLLPGMLLQPYIENSLRHGIQHRPDNNGMISLKIVSAPGNGIICLISDNGIGRKKSEEMKSTRHIEYQSKGTLISQRRIDAINNQLNTTISITTDDIIGSSGEVAGTLVTIVIPQLNKL